jgi:hypothetical protein
VSPFNCPKLRKVQVSVRENDLEKEIYRSSIDTPDLVSVEITTSPGLENVTVGSVALSEIQAKR